MLASFTQHRQTYGQSGDEDDDRGPNDHKAFLKTELVVDETPRDPGETVQQILTNRNVGEEMVIVD